MEAATSEYQSYKMTPVESLGFCSLLLDLQGTSCPLLDSIDDWSDSAGLLGSHEWAVIYLFIHTSPFQKFTLDHYVLKFWFSFQWQTKRKDVNLLGINGP